MEDERICPVCQTPPKNVWICSMKNCPDKIVEVTSAQRKRFIEIIEDIGTPEVKETSS